MSQDYGTPEDRQDACHHLSASLIYAEPNGRWKCDGCDLILAPAFDMINVETFQTTLDAIAGTMSAVLFDYSERMNERYGLRPDAVRTDDSEEAPSEPDDGHPHSYDDNGVCGHCGHSPFLGN